MSWSNFYRSHTAGQR